MKTQLGLLIRLIVAVVFCAIPMLGQGDRGTITGTVTDATGAVVPSAQITAIQKGTNASYKVVTSSSGVFTIPALPTGDYQVRVDKEGFKAHLIDNVAIVPGGEVREDIKLEVGTATQSVEVTAAAQLVQTENARVSTAVSDRLVDTLPVVVNGQSRSPFDLASTTAEVNNAGGFRVAGGGNTVGLTLDGSSIAGDKIGSDANDAARMNSPSVEALTEITVEASGFKAETGHASGGTVSFVSKSGANQFHGSAFEFLRNQDFDARGFFNTVKPVYKQNNFGVTAGGPVYFPRLYNGKNKTFFFASYEGFRNRVGAGNGTLLSVPTPEMYSGDFSKWVDATGKLYPIYDPASQRLENGAYVRTPFPNNIIPSNELDPTAVPIANYLKTLLAPNEPGIVPGTSGYVRNNFFSDGTTISPSDKWSAKIDQNLGSKHHLSYFMNRYKDAEAFGPTGPNGLPYPIGGDVGFNKTAVYRGNWDYTITPTLLNRLYGGFNYFLEDHGSPGRETDQSLALGNLLPAGYWKQKGICIPGYPECSMFPPISTGDFSAWGGTGTNGSDRLVFELHDDMTKTMGAHTFKWGYFLGNSHYDGFGVQNISGTTSYSFRNTSAPGASSEASGGGNGFASFLLGQVSGFSLDTVRYVTLVYRTHQGFFQDDWKVNRRLTLNLGLRFDYNLAPDSNDNRLSDLNLSVPNPAAGGRPGGIVFAGSGPGRAGGKNLIPNWSGLEPRLSFAYAINDKTTIRGAATRSFGALAGTNGSSHFLGFVVHETLNDTTNGILPLWILSQGAPKYNPPPVIDPGCCNGQNPPYWNGINGNRPDGELSYSFNIQRQVTATSGFEVGYLSTLASHLQSNMLALNQVPYRSVPAALNPFTASGRTVLGSLVGSAAANTAGVAAPWTCSAGSTVCQSFNSLWGNGASVTQAMRPYPQFGAIDTLSGGGDRAGHSTYHSLLVKYNKRLGSGLVVQASYVFSKMLGDADAGSGDQYNRRLLKSITSSDQTHQVKITYAYSLPFGRGHWLAGNSKIGSAIVSGWRISGIHTYSSGLPMTISNTVTFPIGEFSNPATITTYNGWTLPYSGRFNPWAESYLQPQSFFPAQPTTAFGNATRYNPKFRSWPGYNESESLAREFRLHEKAHIEMRLESFNLLNRVAFGPLGGATTIGNPNWGLWRNQVNSPRRMQLVAKLTW